MEYKIMERISKEIKDNKRVALAMITESSGSTPAKKGAMMIILEDGSTYGTIGGGNLEYKVTKEAKICIRKNINKNFTFKLDDTGSLHMQCGGSAKVFIKLFKPERKLLIVGGGHIAYELYKLGKDLNFYTVIFDDREEYCNNDRFPEIDELQLGDIGKNLDKYPITKDCFIVIITRGHKNDEVALENVINKEASYIGMIGSKEKTSYIMNNLLDKGINKDKLKKVYAPIGLNLGGGKPNEIAFSIMSEILLIKNNGSLKHMKDID
ncbi:MAG: xanthine dehydrogenase [Firmicutes bacterium]|nr:xanthine dehydrogenase [Bacillota bacterium]